MASGRFQVIGRSLIMVGLLSLTCHQTANAQDLCACSPSVYEFTLDFSLTCPPNGIPNGDGVAAVTCLVSPFGDPDVIDLIPISVETIDVLELDQNLQIIVQENIGGSFGDGDTFQYTSVAALPDQIQDPVDVPRAIQLNIIGTNQFGEPIINVYLISFTNNCGAYPVLSEGQSLGWTKFSELTPPHEELCPVAPPPLPPSEPPSEPLSAPPARTCADVCQTWNLLCWLLCWLFQMGL